MPESEPASSPCQAPPGYWDGSESTPAEPATTRTTRTVLFLGTANHDRSRAAEALFNAVAARLGLKWTAISRGLSVADGPKPKGPMAATTEKSLESRGIRSPHGGRSPLQVSTADFGAADRCVALNRVEQESLLRIRFPDRVDDIEYWQIAAGDVAAIENEVLRLVTRLLGGRMDLPEPQPAPRPEPVKKPVLTARVGRETAGRRGKGVTTIFGLPLSEAELQELATKLKQRVGTGGTVKDGRIEIQGDNRDRVAAELQKLGFQVKRAGG